MKPSTYHRWALVLLTLILLPELFPDGNATGPAPVTQPQAALNETAMLPVHSPSLSPGRVAPRALNLPGSIRLFLVGDDALSLKWLQSRAEQLRQSKAVGMAVQVADAQGLARLRAAAPGVTLLPISGEDLAKRLDLQHYPVLITQSALEQ